MRLSRPWLAGLATAVVAPCLSAAQISIVTNDPPNEGFNDPTPFTAEGGNNATTLGEARLNVVRAAAEQWRRSQPRPLPGQPIRGRWPRARTPAAGAEARRGARGGGGAARERRAGKIAEEWAGPRVRAIGNG